MENQAPKSGIALSYKGSGGTLFGMYLVNVLLSIVTLGIYSFWGKARILRYLYEEGEVAGGEFAFHGTGKEFFLAFLKFLVVLVVFYALVFGLSFAMVSAGSGGWASVALTVLLLLITYSFVAVLVPVALNSRLRYRMSRTTWRGIRLGYTGLNKEFLPLFIKGLLLTLITFGVYGSWFAARQRRYILDHTRFGRLRFAFEGNGKELFLINLKGFLLSVVTIGIYGFWWARDLYRFNIGHVEVMQGERRGSLVADVTAGKVFRLVALNALLALVTLGLATPWIIVRSYRFAFDVIRVEGDLDPDAVEPDPGYSQDALGESMADFLDLGDFGFV